MDGPEIKTEDNKTNETDVNKKEDPHSLECDNIVVNTTHNGVSEHDDSTSEGNFSRNHSNDIKPQNKINIPLASLIYIIYLFQ